MKVLTDRINPLLEWACLLFACLFTGLFIYVACMSMHYPFHLEWMEGQGIDVIQRVRDGLPMYTAPSLEYVPFIYTPYYYYVCAFVSLFTGVDFFPARLVSTLSALGCGAIIYNWIRREGGNWRHGIIAAGIYYSTYRLSARWMDVARIDSLFLFLTLAGLYVFYHYRGWRNAFIAAVLLTAAFFTKQSALLAAGPALAAGLLIDRQHTLRTCGLLALFITAGVFIANMSSNGWFSFYIFDVPAGHTVDERFIYNFWTHNMIRQVGIFFALATAAVALNWNQDLKKGTWYFFLMAGFVGCSYAARLHWGGWLNVLMPAHAALALLTGLSLISLARITPSYWIAAAYGFILLQMCFLVYNPAPLIPTQAAIDEGNRFLAEIANIQGDIFTPELQFVQTRVGKKSYTFGMAGFDVLRSELGDKNYIRDNLGKELEGAIKSHRFGGVFDGRLIRLPAMEGNYKFSRHIRYPKEYITYAINFFRGDLFIPVSENQLTQPSGPDE